MKFKEITIGYDVPFIGFIVSYLERILREKGFEVRSLPYDENNHFTILLVFSKPEIVRNGNFTLCITTFPEVTQMTKKPVLVVSLQELMFSINEFLMGIKRRQ